MKTTPPGTPQPPRFTLEPLRTDGPDALDVEGLEGITHIRLIEIEVAWENEFQAGIIRKASDVFGCAAAEGFAYDPIPRSGRLVQAVFLVEFGPAAEPQFVQLRPPGVLKTDTSLNSGLIERWLHARGFVVRN
jgi:hypothetical protein